jgi:hypothetical protein
MISHRSELDAIIALRRIETLMRAKRGTPEGDYLDALMTLVEATASTPKPASSAIS